MTDLLSRYRRLLLIGCAVLLGSVVAWRFIRLLRVSYTGATDFNLYYAVSRALLQGQPMYNLQSYQQDVGQLVPIVAPPQAVAFFPLSILPYELSYYVYLVLNLVSICLLITLCFRKVATPIASEEVAQATFIAGLLLFNMPPVNFAIWVGQLSGIVALLIVGALLFQNLLLRSLCLALGIALKLSFLPLAALILFSKDRVKILSLTTFFFGVLCFVPSLFGNPLGVTYEAYGEAVSHMMREWNSFASDGGADRIDIGFLKSSIATFSLQALCIGMVLVILFRGNKTVDIFQLFFVAALTMTMFYHRIYDMVLLLVLLLACTYLFVIERKWLHVVVCSAFLLFYLVPSRLMLGWSNTLGGFIGYNDFVYIGARNYGNPPLLTLLPLPAIVTTFLTIYAGYLYFHRGRQTSGAAPFSF